MTSSITIVGTIKKEPEMFTAKKSKIPYLKFVIAIPTKETVFIEDQNEKLTSKRICIFYSVLVDLQKIPLDVKSLNFEKKIKIEGSLIFSAKQLFNEEYENMLCITATIFTTKIEILQDDDKPTKKPKNN